jgi:AcrR family transcriptional regulator
MSEPAERIERAMLEACGERGYRSASVQDALDRCGGNRAQFYRHYSSKQDCFAAGYEREATRLVEAILAAGRRAPAWRAGLDAALAELSAFVARQPALARGVLVEVHVAGGTAAARRRELVGRLVAAIDSARGAPGALAAPPALAATFMFGAIEAAAARALSLGAAAGFPAQVPELSRLVTAAYFGEEAAAGEPAPGSSPRASAVASSAPR